MTFNEQANIGACLESIRLYVDQIVLVDSHSTDATIQLARPIVDQVLVHSFVNQAAQLSWALRNADISNDWILRVDADERWSAEGFDELAPLIDDETIDGVYVTMRVFFMHRWIRHGGFYGNLFLRVFRRSSGSIEQRWMDEHIVVDGRVVGSGIVVDEKNVDRQDQISLWVGKHNDYSTREAVEILINRHGLAPIDSIGRLDGNKLERKRWMKEKFYWRSPLFGRSVAYWMYRYFGRLGFLDGIEGFIFHFLQGFWYRFLVDVKVYQIESNARRASVSIVEAIRTYSGVELEDKSK